MENSPATLGDIGRLYEDVSACLLAMASALEKKGLVSNEEMREAARERFLTLLAHKPSDDRFVILRSMAALPSKPDE